jgi:gamma-butyrobetaine dioxygenase
MQAIETIAELFASEGGREYVGEPVSLASHMLQAGRLAEAARAADALVAAALLHDVGHLVAARSEREDARHEHSGSQWLAQLGFPQEVTRPIRLHVAAKRYLCAVEPAYFEGLSSASRRSLQLQGGPMSLEEAAQFSKEEHAAAAVSVRRWDDAAKDPSAATPRFDEFRPVLERILVRLDR